MVCTSSSWLCAITILLAVSVQSFAQRNAPTNQEASASKPPSNDKEIVAEEVILESSLNVRNPSAAVHRRVRNVLYYIIPDELTSVARAKRQVGGFGGPGFGGPGFGGQGFGYQQPNNFGASQSTAQSNSHSNYFGPEGSLNADALAAAQAFQTNGPNSFGATSSNAATNTQGITPFGSSGSVANSGGQTYNLPNGQTLNIAFNNGFSNTNGRPATSQGSSIAFNG